MQPIPNKNVTLHTNKQLIALFAVVFVDILGLAIMYPILPFLVESRGGSIWHVSLLAAVYAICQFGVSPILGRLSDSFGPKPVLLFSQIGTFLNYILIAFSHSFGAVFAARTIDGLSSGNMFVAQAYAAEITPAGARANVFAKINLGYALAFMAGPIIISFFAPDDFKGIVLLAGGLSAASFIGTFFLIPSRKASTEKVSKKSISWSASAMNLRDAKVQSSLLLSFLVNLGFSYYYVGFVLFLERNFQYAGKPFGAKDVAILFSYLGLLDFILYLFFYKKLVARFAEKKIAFFGLFLASFGFALLTFNHSIPLLVIAVTMTTLGHDLVRPCIPAILSQSVGNQHQGFILGCNNSIFALSRVLGPLAGAALITQGSGGWPAGPLICYGISAMTLVFIKSTVSSEKAAQGKAA